MGYGLIFSVLCGEYGGEYVGGGMGVGVQGCGGECECGGVMVCVYCGCSSWSMSYMMSVIGGVWIIWNLLLEL